MKRQNPVSGVVLAGGMARRMQQQDKGLILFNNRPLVSYALEAMAPLLDEVMISANRNLETYRRFGYPVIEDDFGHFDGPLAGILAAMTAARHPMLLTMPCDSPLLASRHLERLLQQLDADAEIAAAFDGERLYPVFAVLRTELRHDLLRYLQSGERRLEYWFRSRRLQIIDFSDQPQVFANINTPEHLKALEAESG